MTKKVISVLLCITMLLCTSFTAFAESNYPRNVSEPVRVIDGIGELLQSFFGLFSLKSKFPETVKLCSIPDIDKGYVPQGFCYIDSMELFAVTSYSDGDDNSIVSLIDAKSGERIKTVKLQYEDSTPCRAHVGGVADMGDSLLVSSGKSVRRLKIDDVMNAEDYSYVNFCGKFSTDMQASYVCSYENYLFVGQFYSFTPNGTYDTPVEQRIYTPDGKRNYAMCEKYDMSDLDKAFNAGSGKPEIVISMPNGVQGIAFNGETFATSTSYTLRNPSKIRYYNLKESDYVFNMNGNDIPLYCLSEKEAVKTVKIPPMSEGIDWHNGKVAGIFESGANKFPNARARTPYVCMFDC